MPATITVAVRAATRPGQPVTVRVWDTGNAPARVHVGIASKFTVQAQRYPLPDGTKVSWHPGAFTLEPGHSKAVRVVVRTPKGAQGNRFANVVFLARSASKHGVAVQGGAATQLEVRLSGPEPAPKAITVQPPQPASPGGFDWPLAGLGLVVLAAMVLAAILTLRHRKAEARA